MMKPRSKPGIKPRFSIAALKELAGDKVFARGEAYHSAGQVALLRVDAARVLAVVAGTEDYRTELTGRGREIGGRCSCPAFEDWGFCKHMVATALTANAAGDTEAATEAVPLPSLRDYLKGLGIDALVDLILDLSERDMALLRRLDMAAATAGGSDKAIETRLRKAIDAATRMKGYIGYREVGGWAAGVGEALDALATLVPSGRAGLALTLADHALARIEAAAQDIDDSDGHCGALMHRAGEIRLAAIRLLRPDPVTLARDLLSREMRDDYDIFDGAVDLYADMLGDVGLREYRRLALEEWDALPARMGPDRGRAGGSGDYGRLARILDLLFKRDDDPDARIALRAKNLSSPWAYLELATFCLENGRPDEALRRAEEGLWIFEDGRLDERLLLFTVELLLKSGRDADAQTHLWRAFDKAPNLQLFARLRPLGGEAARDRALASLNARLVAESTSPKTGWYSRSTADLLIRILMQETMFDAAWATVRRSGASSALKEELALASEATYPAEAIETYIARIEDLAEGGGNAGYETAARLIARMGMLTGAAEHAAYVAGIKLRFRRKRNFMKLLA